MDGPDDEQLIAKHVMNIHMNRPNSGEDGDAVGEIDLERMKAYIAYAKGWVRK